MKHKPVIRSFGLALLLVFITGCASRTLIESQSERQFEDMRSDLLVSTDVEVRQFVFCVTNAILPYIDEPWNELDWDVEIFDSPSVNAFAMAGENVGVFTGLLAVVDNQDQLATVIGHELAHVTADHPIETANRNSAASTVAGAVGAAYGGNMGNTAAMGAQLGVMLPFSRGQESEADTLGLSYMAAAGFDPRESVKLWKNMDAKAGGNSPPEFFSTHPAPDNRISKLIKEMPDALNLYNEAVAAGRRPDCPMPR